MHLDPMTRSVLARERAEQLRESMLASRRRRNDPVRPQAPGPCAEPASLFAPRVARRALA
jgi:hypothetical protein